MISVLSSFSETAAAGIALSQITFRRGRDVYISPSVAGIQRNLRDAKSLIPQALRKY